MNSTIKVKSVAYTLLCTLSLSFLVSCEKDLETTPTTSIEEVYVFDTPERILGQVNSLYDAVKSGNFLGGRYLIYNDIRADEFINMKANPITGLLTWNYGLISSTSEVENLWTAAYAAINKCNLFLKRSEENASKVDPVLYPQYRAEAKFLRALCYYDLVVLYARPYTMTNGETPGLPLRLNAETTVENNDLARSSVKNVYLQIINDLNEAEANLPLSYGIGNDLLNVTRAHKNTAIALKTRVYLSMGKYDEVITEAQKIISSAVPYQANSGVPLKLEPNVATPFTKFTTPESVFSMPMTDGDNPGTQNQLAYYYNKTPIGNGEYSLNAKGIFANTEWKATDARRTSFIITGSTNYLKKFNNPATDYVPVIRYAETILNYAEAAARVGDLIKAVELLKAIRNRSDATYVFPAAAIDTQDALIQTILTERRIELLAEGFRSIDLLRQGSTIPGKGTVNPVLPGQREYIWPIPNSEMLTNKLMIQN